MVYNPYNDNNNSGNKQDLLNKESQPILIGRVTKIYLENTDDANLGAIEVESVDTYNKTTVTAYPFFPHMTSYPLIDEIVLLNRLPSEMLGSSEDSKKWYYLGVVNIWNNPHVNFFPNPINNNIPLSERKSYQDTQAGSIRKSAANNPDSSPQLQGTFSERENIHPLQPYLGDVIYQGRWGNSIRLGSTAFPSNQEWSQVGENGDPITIVRNGQPKTDLPNEPWTPIDENINEDPSSIYLTSTQKIPLFTQNSSFFSYETPPDTPDQYVGPQVILNSDRLVFNAKKDHVLISGQESVNLSSNNSLNFDTKKFIIDAGEIKLGSKNATEPLILGDTFLSNLNHLVTGIEYLCIALQGSTIWPVGAPVPDATQSTPASELLARAKQFKAKINKYKSKTSKTI